VTGNLFVLSVSMQGQLPQNLYYWRIRALNSSQEPITDWSSARSFILLEELFGPVLLSPDDSVKLYKGSEVVLSWQPISGASYYWIWMDNNSGFGSPEVGFDNGQSPNWVDGGIVSGSQFTLTVSMQNQLPQNVYYWKVNAFNANQGRIIHRVMKSFYNLLTQ